MSDDDRKPIWPWIAVAAIGLPIAYAVSFGPALCLHQCWPGRSPDLLVNHLQSPDPMDWIISVTPGPESSRLWHWYYDTYLQWWADLGHSWR